MSAGLRGSLSTTKLVFLVIAAAAPLSAVVGTVPLAFAVGTGSGVPAMYVLAGVVLLCFAVGYAAMSRNIVNAGGFYSYILHGLGRPVAVAAGYIAVLAYLATSIGLLAGFGYFADLIAGLHGLHLSWEVWSGAALLAVGLLGFRQIDLSARVLSLLILGEVGILAALDLAIAIHRGASSLPSQSVHPHQIFSGAVGVTMMFAFISFIGFESAALYGEETANPKRSVPIATYTSVAIIAAFYGLSSWLAVGGVGVGQIQPIAQEQLGNLFFGLSEQYLDDTATTIMQVLLCTSFFAAVVALHNATNRYVYVMGRERLLPSWFAGVHPRHASPHRASMVQTAVAVVVLAVAAIVGLNPYLNVATSLLGLGTLGIVGLQATAAIAVLGFFRRRADRHWWRTALAPALGAIGLIGAGVLLLRNFGLLTGSTNPVVRNLPWLLALVVVDGLLMAWWLRSKRPERYEALRPATVAEPAVVTPVPSPQQPVAEPVG